SPAPARLRDRDPTGPAPAPGRLRDHMSARAGSRRSSAPSGPGRGGRGLTLAAGLAAIAAGLLAGCSGERDPARSPAAAPGPPPAPPERYDVLVRGGMVHDGSGDPGS